MPRPNFRMEDYPLWAVRDCLFSIFASTLHIWRPSPPSTKPRTLHAAVTETPHSLFIISLGFN